MVERTRDQSVSIAQNSQLSEIAALLRAHLKILRMLLQIIGKDAGVDQKALDDVDEAVVRHLNEEIENAEGRRSRSTTICSRSGL
jgi:hypothetical protein